MLICVKQHLSNIWSSFRSWNEAELKKSLLIKNKSVYSMFFFFIKFDVSLLPKSIIRTTENLQSIISKYV